MENKEKIITTIKLTLSGILTSGIDESILSERLARIIASKYDYAKILELLATGVPTKVEISNMDALIERICKDYMGCDFIHDIQASLVDLDTIKVSFVVREFSDFQTKEEAQEYAGSKRMTVRSAVFHNTEGKWRAVREYSDSKYFWITGYDSHEYFNVYWI